MKLRQAIKIVKRVSTEGMKHRWYGKPLPKNWRKLASKMHKAQAVFNHHCIPFGRMANKWSNGHTAKICKATRTT